MIVIIIMIILVSTKYRCQPHLHAFYPVTTKGAGISQSVQQLGYGLDVRGKGVLLALWTREFSVHHNVQTGSEADPASYQLGTGSKAAGA
jgi:hypothetical protein